MKKTTVFMCGGSLAPLGGAMQLIRKAIFAFSSLSRFLEVCWCAQIFRYNLPFGFAGRLSFPNPPALSMHRSLHFSSRSAAG